MTVRCPVPGVLWLAAQLLLSASLGACDGIGRALVAQASVPERVPELTDLLPCPEPVACDEPVVAPQIPARSAQAFELRACPLSRSALPVCPEADPLPPFAADDDGGVPFDDGLAPDAGFAEPCMPAESFDSLRERAAEPLKCAELSVELASQSGAPLELPNLRLDLVNLQLRASEPVTLRLPEAFLQHAFIELQGPVQLEILQAGWLQELHVRGHATDAGAPGLRVVEHDARQLIVGGPGQPFEGTVELVRVAVRLSQLVAHSASLQSATFYDGTLDARQLDVAESDLDTVLLRVGHGRISASSVALLEVLECGTLSLLGTSSEHSNYVACSDGPLRAYQSNVSDGLLDGVIDTDLTDICHVRLGRRSATELRLWSGTLLGTNLCQHTEAVLIGGRAARNGCESPELEASDRMCTLQEDQKLDDNFCDLFQQAQPCAELPARDRPEQDRENLEGRLINRN